jgi:hypothetical protein
MMSTSCLIIYMAYAYLTKKHSKIVTITGVKMNNDRELITIEDDTRPFHHVVIKYTLDGCQYCIVSESKDYILPISTDTSYHVVSATLVLDTIDVDVTEKIQQIAGPHCDFHDEPIDFSWIFPGCKGVLEIEFNNSTCSVDLLSNTITSGCNHFIQLYQYN